MTSSETFSQLVNGLQAFIDSSIMPLLIALAFIAFLIGIVRYFFSQSDESREKGRQFALWGILGLVIIFSIWGIVSVFVNALSS